MAEQGGQVAQASSGDSLVDAFEAVLTEETAAEPAQAEAKPAGAQEPGDGAATPEDQKPADEAKAKEGEEEAPAEDTVEIDPDAELFETEIVTAEGKEAKKLSLKELQQGYMRTADYTRKTQAVAREREELQGKIAEGEKQIAKNYVDRLNAFEQLLVNVAAPELSKADWNKLAAEDPSEYVRLSNRAQQLQQVMLAIKQERDTLTAREKEEQNKSRDAQIRKSLEFLQERVPGWGEETYQRVLQGASQYGFSAKEIGEQVDGRYIAMAHDALKYRELQAAKPAVSKKVAVVPKVIKPGTRPAGEQDGRRAALQTLKKSQKPGDLKAFFEASL